MTNEKTRLPWLYRQVHCFGTSRTEMAGSLTILYSTGPGAAGGVDITMSRGPKGEQDEIIMQCTFRELANMIELLQTVRDEVRAEVMRRAREEEATRELKNG